jgi:hypothetical protein
MALVTIVVSAALVQYLLFVLRAGRARGQSGVPAPASIGNPDFERNLRVQYNTIEQLVVFLPAVYLFAWYVSEPVAAGLGVLFIIGRGLYARAYVTDPSKRGPGFGLTIIPNFILTLGALVGAVLTLL